MAVFTHKVIVVTGASEGTGRRGVCGIDRFKEGCWMKLIAPELVDIIAAQAIAKRR